MDTLWCHALAHVPEAILPGWLQWAAHYGEYVNAMDRLWLDAIHTHYCTSIPHALWLVMGYGGYL